MMRFFAMLMCVVVLVSCSKKDDKPAVTPIPDLIFGTVKDIVVTPVDLNTPGKATMLISMNNALYKVQFDATTQAEANATIFFDEDTIVTKDSREYGNFGQDFVAYNPLHPNFLEITFTDGIRKIEGGFDSFTTFGGNFNRDLIAQWREANDPSKPTQKAMDDIRNLVMRYNDSNGPEAGITPVYLAVSISRQ